MAVLNTAPGGATVLTAANLTSHSALSSGRYVVLPPGDFTLNETIVLEGVRLVGAGMDSTRIWVTASGTMEIRAQSASARRVDLGYNTSSRMGAGLESLAMIYTGDLLTPANGVYVKNPSDWILLQDVALYDFPTGIYTDAAHRESVYNRVHLMRCGRNGAPAILIEQVVVGGTTDGANNLLFRDCFVEYPYGPLMRVKNHMTTETIRSIVIEGGLWHGLHSEIGTRLPSSQATYPLFELEGPGLVRDIKISPSRMVGPGPDVSVPVIRLVGDQTRFANIAVSGLWHSAFQNILSNAVATNLIATTGLRVTGRAILPMNQSSTTTGYRRVSAE
jgi:hypothetical protein